MGDQRLSSHSRRRWFAFSLRTLFVAVTLLCVGLAWVGWQKHLIHERKTLLETELGPAIRSIGVARAYRTRPDGGLIFRIKSQWGYYPIDSMLLPKKLDPKLLDRLKAAFPETRIQLIDGTGATYQIVRYSDDAKWP